MGSFGVVELEGVRERVEHRVGDAGGVAAFESLVVLEADAGERRDLFAAESLDAAGAVRWQTDLLRREVRPARGEELRELGCCVHGLSLCRVGGSRGVLPVPL